MTYLFNTWLSELTSAVLEHLALVLGGVFLFLLGMFVVQSIAHSFFKMLFRGLVQGLRNRYVILFLCVPLGMGLHTYLGMTLSHIVDAQAQLGLTSDAPPWYSTEEGGTLLYNSTVTILMFLAAFLPRYGAKCVAGLVTGHGLASMGLLHILDWGNLGLSQYLSMPQQIAMVVAVALAIALTAQRWRKPTWRFPTFKLALPQLRWPDPPPPAKAPLDIGALMAKGEAYELQPA